MNYVNTKKAKNGFSPFLLLIWVIFAIAFFVKIFIFDGFTFILLLFIVFLSAPILYFLDIFLWHIIGKEIIYTQDGKLIIKKTNRILPRKKKIRFNKIEDVYFWKTKGFFKDIYSSMSAFWDWDKQGAICIEYDNGCKYYVGRNLDEVEANELLEFIKSEIGFNFAEKSKKRFTVSELIILIVLILLILVITIRIM